MMHIMRKLEHLANIMILIKKKKEIDKNLIK